MGIVYDLGPLVDSGRMSRHTYAIFEKYIRVCIANVSDILANVHVKYIYTNFNAASSHIVRSIYYLGHYYNYKLDKCIITQ